MSHDEEKLGSIQRIYHLWGCTPWKCLKTHRVLCFILFSLPAGQDLSLTQISKLRGDGECKHLLLILIFLLYFVFSSRGSPGELCRGYCKVFCFPLVFTASISLSVTAPGLLNTGGENKQGKKPFRPSRADPGEVYWAGLDPAHIPQLAAAHFKPCVIAVTSLCFSFWFWDHFHLQFTFCIPANLPNNSRNEILFFYR